MSQASQQRITDLKVTGHLMTLQTGLFCISHAAGQQPPTSAGLPGVRISLPPFLLRAMYRLSRLSKMAGWAVETTQRWCVCAVAQHR